MEALEIVLKGAEIIILRVKVNSFKGMLMKMLLDEFTLQTVANPTNINYTNQKAQTELTCSIFAKKSLIAALPKMLPSVGSTVGSPDTYRLNILLQTFPSSKRI